MPFSMDGFLGSSAVEQGASNVQSNIVTVLPVLAVAVGVWLLEQQRRTGGMISLRGVSKAVREFLPELACLVFGGAIVAAMLHRWNGHLPVPSGSQGNASAEDHEVAQEITNEWPWLTTADSLLGMQAALRLLLIASVTLRSMRSNAAVFSFEPSAFFSLAAFCRVLLLALSPQDVYHLDGPLGGNLNVVLEVLCFVFLVRLCSGKVEAGFRRFVSVAVVTTLAGLAAWCHRFSLAHPGEEHLDVLFSLGQLLELAAAGTFLINTVSELNASRPTAAGFAYCVLPVQQFLQAYFICTAFADPFQVEPALVGAGRPFEVMQTCALTQVALYVVAAIWHFLVADDDDFKVTSTDGNEILLTAV